MDNDRRRYYCDVPYCYFKHKILVNLGRQPTDPQHPEKNCLRARAKADTSLLDSERDQITATVISGTNPPKCPFGN